MNHTKNIFIMTGESSGDALAAWYIGKQRAAGMHAHYTAVGGERVSTAGATLFRGIDDLSVVGVTEIIRHLPHLLRVMRQIVAHILSQSYDEVVLVDYPGFNLRLLRKLKKTCPTLKVIYLSPPQLWVWGAWRVKTLRQYADRVVVLYPFEVTWYQQRGVHAEWLGSPVCDALDASLREQQLSVPAQERDYDVVLLPGSRRQEIQKLGPIYAAVLTELAEQFPDLRVAVIVAPSLTEHEVREALGDLKCLACPMEFVERRREALRVRTQAVCALTKPGTNTLELALLGIPGAVIYKTSWLTYWLARMVINVTSMTLPNLLLGKQLYPEFIQDQCQSKLIAKQLAAYITAYRNNRAAYEALVAPLKDVRKQLKT